MGIRLSRKTHEHLAGSYILKSCTFVVLLTWTKAKAASKEIQVNKSGLYYLLGGTVASWLVRSTPEWALQVRSLAGDIVLCSWARHFTLTLPLSTQVYKWVLANLMLGVTLWWTSIPSRGESQSLYATETGISSRLMGHLAQMQT